MKVVIEIHVSFSTLHKPFQIGWNLSHDWEQVPILLEQM